VKIRPVRAELFQFRWTDGRTWQS